MNAFVRAPTQRPSILALALLALSVPAFSEGTGPVGVVTEAQAARIRRAGTQTDVPSYVGDLLFPGDTLLLKSGKLTISFCPTHSSYSFDAGEVRVESAALLLDGRRKLNPGRPLPVCRLPAVQPEGQSDLHLYADRIQISADADSAQSNASDQLTAEQRASVEPMDSAIKVDPANITARIARAVALEGMGNADAAAREYRTIYGLAPNALWSADKAQALIAQHSRSKVGDGHIFGVVVGISEYKWETAQPLQFADKDAQAFYDYLVSPRGGANKEDICLLINERATAGAIRTEIAAAFARAKESDTVVLFIAAHGIAEETGKNRGAYIVAYDSNPQDLAATGLRMEDLQGLTDGPLRPRQVRMFVDACHSGHIGEIQSRKFNPFLSNFVDENRPSTLVFGFMASRRNELSYECSNYSHGAFTYFLLRALNTDDAKGPAGQITTGTIIRYVQQNVGKATEGLGDGQNPDAKGSWGNQLQLVNPGLGVSMPTEVANPDACVGSRGRGAQTAAPPQNVQAAPSDPFSDALQKGNILPGVPGSAFDMLTRMRTTLAPAEYLAARNRLLIDLENAGQQVILQYLKGEAVPQTVGDFERGEAIFAAAASLLPGSRFIESRRLFCRGRVLVFRRQYDEAIRTLEEAIRVNATGAFSYNALGIAFLETANFQRATPAFQDAVQLAPYWAYARHNLALALTQSGQYTEAIATYQAASALGPAYSYIPYNLGLLYERLNRSQEARAAWQDALAVTPHMIRAWTAIGLSYFLERRWDRAEEAYRRALELANRQPDTLTDRLAVRHDLALLLVARHQSDEAIQLWRLNIAENREDVPSLVGLSSALVEDHRIPEAVETFSALLDLKPDYAGARLQYAKLLLARGKSAEALGQLFVVVDSPNENPEACELAADLIAQPKNGREHGDSHTALLLYERALHLTTSPEQRRQINRKMGVLKKRPLE